jgi:opacity protein-like surface antigen
MKILLFLTLILPCITFAEEAKTYLQTGVIFMSRNFEEATASNTNDGIESLEGGFSLGTGHRFAHNFAVEAEFIQSMGFEVQNAGRAGEISMYALTIAPVYIFKPSFLPEQMELFAKFRIGYTKMQGTDILGNNGKEDSITGGMGFGVTYKFNENWSGLIDLGGLWADDDIEDYDFHPWQVGIRFHF